MTLSNTEIIKGIATKNTVIINALHASIYPFVRGMVLHNSGNQQDAEDVYHEAFMAVYARLKDGGIELTVPFHRYFLSICHKMWLKKIRGQKLIYGSMLDFEGIVDEQFYCFHREQNELKSNLVKEQIQKLDPESRKVLELFISNHSFKNIAKKMNYGNEQRAIKKKYTAKKQLMRALSKNPIFKELIE